MTRDLVLSREGVEDFVDRKEEFLLEVFRGLGVHERAALALLFMNGGRLESPLHLSDEDVKALERMGSSAAELTAAIQSLDGAFVRMEVADDRRYWIFRHPTMRDAVSTLVRGDAELVDIYLSGAKDDEVFHEVVCGSVETAGTVEPSQRPVIVPLSRYASVISRLDACASPKHPLRRLSQSFLASRCSRSFLEAYLSANPQYLNSLLGFTSYMSVSPEIRVLAALRRNDLLPESVRGQCVERIRSLAVQIPDSDWVPRSSDAGSLLDEKERESILADIHDELVPDLNDVIDSWLWSCTEETYSDAEDYFSALDDALRRYSRELSQTDEFWEDASKIESALEHIVDVLITEFAEEDDESDEVLESIVPRPSANQTVSIRDRFDDIDEV